MTAVAASAPAPARRRLDVNLHETHIGLWQDNPNDSSFKVEIFDGLLRLLKRRGFKITADPTVSRRHRCISPSYRIAARGDMRAAIHVSGRVVQLDWWSERSLSENSNGPRYGFDKRRRMPYLDGIRFELERKHILAWVAERADLSFKAPRGAKRCGIGRGELTAAEYIQAQYADCWHTDKALGRPKAEDYNRKSADGGMIEHGARVWAVGRKGRIFTGVAHYSLNNRWMIATGAYGIEWASSFEVYTRRPENIRVKRNERARRKRLEGELAKAIMAMNFLRAEVLRKILFGAELTYGIWATDKSAYYRSNCSGYTTDRIAAGRYTWDEAAREVRRVPGELRLVLPDGTMLEAHQLDQAQAA